MRIDKGAVWGETPLQTLIFSFCASSAMAYDPTSGPDPLPPAFPEAGGLFVQSTNATDPSQAQPLPETDLADLTARFAASSGPGLSPELSAELALEIVLHEIVEQTCLATGATGAAIVLERDGEMVCRASAGPTAPELGARLDGGAGLSGECIRTREVQWCEDAWVDSRADGEASRRLGVRSVVVLPLVLKEKVVGIFEAFSSRASAFGERDERTLEALVGRVVKNLERAAHPFELAQERARTDDAANRQSAEVIPPVASRRGLEIVTWAMGAVVLVSALWLGTRAAQRFAPRRAGVPSAPAKAGASGAQVGQSAGGRVEGVSSQQNSPAVATPAPPKVSSGAGRRRSPSVPEGGLLVFENGREVFRMDPSPGPAVNRAEESGVQRASTVESEGIVKLAPDAVEDSLVHRVEPEYPEQARQQRIQGPVVLETRINPDGTVGDLKVVSGHPLLADAAMAAVKQWRFRPHSVNGQQVGMETRVTIKFTLPAD